MITELIKRYQKRLTEIWAKPNPYYSNKLHEKSDIELKIKQLTIKIKTNK